MRKKNNKWKTFWTVVATLFAVVAIFASVVGVMSYIHQTGFFEEIASWLPAVDGVVSTTKIHRR